MYTRTFLYRFLATLLAALLTNGLALAADWTASPKLRLSTTVDDNRLLRASGQKVSSSTVLNLRVPLNRKAPRWALRLEPRIRVERVVNEEDLDNVAAEFDLAGSYAFERSSFQLETNITRDTTLTTALEDLGTVVEERVTRLRYTVGPSLAWAVSQRASIESGISYQRVEYEDVPGSGLVDFDFASARLDGSYQLHPKTTASAGLSYSRFDTRGDGQDRKSASLRSSISQQFTPTVSSTLSAGTSVSTAEDFDEDSTFSFSGGLSLRKRFERGGITGNYRRSLRPTSTGNLVERDEVGLSLQRRLGVRLSADASALWFQDRGLGVTGADSENFLRASLSLRQQLGKRWRIQVRYRYRRNDQDDVLRDSNSVFLGIEYSGASQSSSP